MGFKGAEDKLKIPKTCHDMILDEEYIDSNANIDFNEAVVTKIRSLQ
jgi:hypothetical protein